MTKPRYNVSRQNRMRARRVETEDASRGRRGTVQCPQCGAWTVNPGRRHRDPYGGDCKVVEVCLDTLPPVEIPPARGRPLGVGIRESKPADERGPRLYGECEDCGAFVTGERRFCGNCMVEHDTRRRQ